MFVLHKILESLETIPTGTAWYLTDLAEARGKQELYTKQAPQRLRTLRENAIIESAVSSNRIEGVEIDGSRVGTVVFGRRHLKDRDEEEVRGYRKALEAIHAKGSKLLISEKTMLELHSLARGEIWDAGKYKEKDGNIIERGSDGKSRVRFVTVSARETPKRMRELISAWNGVKREEKMQPLIAVAAFNLDFLCIHPFRDGNGRVSRLLFLLQCYHFGFEVGRYISLERIIEENKDRYYETLSLSSQGWHEGKSDPWPFINFMLSILRLAYKEFESRLEGLPAARGEKTENLERAIHAMTGPFRVADLQHQCPGIGVDHIRKILARLSKQGRVRCLGRGQNATWEKA